MRSGESAHSDEGLKAVLSKPQIYNLFSKIVGRKGNAGRFVQNAIKPFPGCRILDIGCGTGRILSHLPDSIGEYEGFDMSASYIEAARTQWKDRNNCSFFCQKVSDATIEVKEHYDIVLAIGVLHHLTDAEAGDLVRIAHQVLKKKGALITYDPVHEENQHWFAKWFISKDRGQSVRTVVGYRQLIATFFGNIEGDVLRDTLRIPYTIYQTRCRK